MTSWRRRILARTSLCWLAPGGRWGCDGRRPCCCARPGPVVTTDNNYRSGVFCEIWNAISNRSQSNSAEETEHTGKKILCGMLSFFDGLLKRPLVGLRNHMRWTPPFSSPSSSREGCSRHWSEKKNVALILKLLIKSNYFLTGVLFLP